MAANPDGGHTDRNMVKEVVKNIIILDYSKKPFKYSDAVSSLNPKPTRKKCTQIFNEAKEYLKNMGLIVHDTKIGSRKMYFVTSQTQPLETMYKYACEEEVSDRILLTFVLTFVFMKNGTVGSDRIFNHLHLLGIYDESKPVHPYFGNVKKKVLSEFSDQLYLSLVKTSVEPELYEVQWGKRAEIELSKRDILEFICQQGFGGKVQPQEHTSHYQLVLEQEERANGDEEEEEEEEEVVVVPDFESDDSDILEVGPSRRA